jgi:hypothetical protein
MLAAFGLNREQSSRGCRDNSHTRRNQARQVHGVFAGGWLESDLQERDGVEKRAEELQRKAEAQAKRADELYLETLRLQAELARLKKVTYGPRADRLSVDQLAQMLLEFVEAFEQKPIHSEDLRKAEAEPELRKVKRRKGRRALVNFEKLSAKRSAARRAGRSSIFRDTSNACSTYARSMRVLAVNMRERIRGSQ